MFNAQQILQFVRTQASSAATGLAPEEIIKQRLQVCQSCPFLNAERHRCEQCGCRVSDDRWLLNKLAHYTSACPLNLWRTNGSGSHIEATASERAAALRLGDIQRHMANLKLEAEYLRIPERQRKIRQQLRTITEEIGAQIKQKRERLSDQLAALESRRQELAELFDDRP